MSNEGYKQCEKILSSGKQCKHKAHNGKFCNLHSGKQIPVKERILKKALIKKTSKKSGKSAKRKKAEKKKEADFRDRLVSKVKSYKKTKENLILSNDDLYYARAGLEIFLEEAAKLKKKSKLPQSVGIMEMSETLSKIRKRAYEITYGKPTTITAEQLGAFISEAHNIVVEIAEGNDGKLDKWNRVVQDFMDDEKSTSNVTLMIEEKSDEN